MHCRGTCLERGPLCQGSPGTWQRMARGEIHWSCSATAQRLFHTAIFVQCPQMLVVAAAATTPSATTLQRNNLLTLPGV